MGAPLVGRYCPCFSSLPVGHTWSLFFCQKAIEEATRATPGLGKGESCVVPRPSDEGVDAESSHCASERLFYLYVDNLGALGTSRVYVDKDLMMLVQTFKIRGLVFLEEIVHSNTATALGIHFGLRNMLVSVAPMRLWRLKQGSSMGAALPGSARKNVRSAFGANDFCGPAQTRRAQCALCPQ